VFREGYAKKFSFNLDAIFQDLTMYKKELKDKQSKGSPTNKRQA
jgi:hypothetical protein